MNDALAKKTRRTNSRQAILDAAACLVSEMGASHVTLEAVAARAGVSKGGLLYNFPSKTVLLSAMIEECLAEAMEALEAEEKESGGDPLRLIRNLMDMRFQWLLDAEAQSQAQGILAAAAQQPALLEPVRRYQAAVWDRIKALAPDPDALWTVWLAVEGLFLSEPFRVSPLSAEERSRIIERLVRQVDRLLPAAAGS